MPTFQNDMHAVLRFRIRLEQFKQFDVAHFRRVDLGGSQFSESILERWYFANASQQNVVILEFGSPCSPRSALFARDLIRHGLRRVSPFFHEVLCLNVECFAFMKKERV